MTIVKLATAASLLIFAGLAAWAAAGLAAQARKRTPPLPPSAATAAPLPLAKAMKPTAESPEASGTQREDLTTRLDPVILAELPPVVVNVEPKVGAVDVDPGLREIRVTFSKEMMDKSWSWTHGNVYSTPKSAGTIHYEKGKRTCVMPVELEPGKTYVVGINSERYRGFKDKDGRAALPYLLAFRTRAAK
jgi:RNA polymerase sigma-70 factor (ECF subfamily)